LTLKQSLALAERVYGECALIAANRDLSPAEAEIAREAAKLAWVEVRSARKALASHERANGLVVSSSARQPFSIKPDYPADSDLSAHAFQGEAAH
jgi:hypothetical protein